MFQICFVYNYLSSLPPYFTHTFPNRVFTETLRKYPAVPFLDRMCCTDFKLPAPTENGTITLPAGIGIYIPILCLHHDPKYFPESEKFDPDHLKEENKSSSPNYTYIPFGEVPRMCIGRNRHLNVQHITTIALAIKPK